MLHFIARHGERLDSALSSAAEQSDSTHRCEAKGCLSRARSERRAALHRLRGGAAVWTIMQGSLEEDFVVLRKLRDESECDELKQAWSSEDPREWRFEYEGKQQPCVTVADGRVTVLTVKSADLTVLPNSISDLGALQVLNLWFCSGLKALPATISGLGSLKDLTLWGCGSVVELPDAVGDLRKLTELNVQDCGELAALPDTIGELGELTMLNLVGCSNLEKLPDAIDGREGLTVQLPIQLMTDAPLLEDFAVLRKLRDNDASGALKEYFGDDEDPLQWTSLTSPRR